MYFSTFKLDMENPEVCRSVSDGFLMHHHILSDIFHCNKEEAGLLYGVHKKHLVVKSDIPPRFPNASPFDFIKTDDMSDTISAWTNGTVFKFLMNSTPYWRDHDPVNNKKRRHHYYKTLDQRIQWLAGKLKEGGANPIWIKEVSKKDIILGNKENKKDPKSKSHVTQWTYNGLLEITDIEKFKEMYSHGIGNQLIYGNGFLVLYR